MNILYTQIHSIAYRPDGLLLTVSSIVTLFTLAIIHIHHTATQPRPSLRSSSLKLVIHNSILPSQQKQDCFQPSNLLTLATLSPGLVDVPAAARAIHTPLHPIGCNPDLTPHHAERRRFLPSGITLASRYLCQPPHLPLPGRQYPRLPNPWCSQLAAGFPAPRYSRRRDL